MTLTDMKKQRIATCCNDMVAASSGKWFGKVLVR